MLQNKDYISLHISVQVILQEIQAKTEQSINVCNAQCDFCPLLFRWLIITYSQSSPQFTGPKSDARRVFLSGEGELFSER
jgi:hypothetical protein